MKDNSISVIVPAYNAAAYIFEALQSIRKQTLQPEEVIVVDDGSTDDTGAIASTFPGVHYLKQSNLGTAAALNAGIENSSGTLLAFLDADDLWMPERLECQTRVLEQQPEIEMVFGGIEQFISPELPEEEKQKIDLNSAPMTGLHKSTWLIRRGSFMKVGLFKGRFALEEFVGWYIHAKDLKIREAIVGKVVAKRRIHLSNSSRVNKNLRMEFPKLLKAALDRRRANS